MSTTTATPSPLSPAELAAFYDAQEAAEAERRRAEEAAELAARQQIADDLDAEILAAAHAAGIDPQYLTYCETGNFYRRSHRIAMPGFAPFELRAEYNNGDKIAVRVWLNGNNYGKAEQAAIFNAMAAARRKWVENENAAAAETARRAAAKAEHQAEAAQRRQHDAAALAAWAPLYRQYLADLSAAHAHNAAILRPIAEEYGRKEFRAARLTYGITAEESDPTTETVWINSDTSWGGYHGEINPKTGRTEPAHFIHVVKITAWQTWTAADAYARRDWRDEAPPTRHTTIRTGAGNWQIVAPPAAGDLRSEIEPQLGDLASAPERPDLPALWQPSAGEELARQIEAEQIPDAETRAALAEYLAGDFPSADPIPF